MYDGGNLNNAQVKLVVCCLYLFVCVSVTLTTSFISDANNRHFVPHQAPNSRTTDGYINITDIRANYAIIIVKVIPTNTLLKRI